MQTFGTEVQVPVDERHSSSAQKTAVRLLSIGVFARRSRLSTKALRLYDRLGVLAPAHVDELSGYRRYRESQLAAARLVAMLRRLNMPLSQIAEVVSAAGIQGAEVAMLKRPEPGTSPSQESRTALNAGARGAELVASTGNQSSVALPHKVSWRYTFKTDSGEEKGVSTCTRFVNGMCQDRWC
jgi:DNA-binding transcriptional MerR regulator